ncbi:hypothetical protein DFH11DRAFT_1589779, partial [Phellopilus nigrolimitatus]
MAWIYMYSPSRAARPSLLRLSALSSNCRQSVLPRVPLRTSLNLTRTKLLFIGLVGYSYSGHPAAWAYKSIDEDVGSETFIFSISSANVSLSWVLLTTSTLMVARCLAATSTQYHTEFWPWTLK